MHRGDKIDASHVARNVHIGEDQRDVVVRVEHRERFFGIASLKHGRAGILGDIGGDEADERFVDDDQDSAARQSTNKASSDDPPTPEVIRKIGTPQKKECLGLSITRGWVSG